MKARMNRNPRKLRYNSNRNRPNGAGTSAASSDPRALLIAALGGNRATRRLARRNLKKRLRAEGLIR